MGKKICTMLMFILLLPAVALSQEEVTIYEIQQGGYEDQVVITTGVVTADHTVFKDDTYEYVFIEDPQGGAYSGLLLYSITQGKLTCEYGDEIRVQGTVSEYYDMTELTYITDFEILGKGQVPEAEVVSTLDISNDNKAEAEKWESVLIVVHNADVTGEPDQYGQFTINDGTGEAVVDDWKGYEKKPYDYEPVVGDEIDVRGVLYYSFDEFKIEPRNNSDIPDVEVKVNIMSWGQLKASVQ
jgi:hypothetical protein